MVENNNLQDESLMMVQNYFLQYEFQRQLLLIKDIVWFHNLKVNNLGTSKYVIIQKRIFQSYIGVDDSSGTNDNSRTIFITKMV